MKRMILPVLLSLCLLAVGGYTLRQSWKTAGQETGSSTPPDSASGSPTSSASSADDPGNASSNNPSGQSTPNTPSTSGLQDGQQAGVYLANDHLTKGSLVLVTAKQVMINKSAGDLVNVYAKSNGTYKFSSSSLTLTKETTDAWNKLTAAFYAKTKNNAVTLVSGWLEKPAGDTAPEHRTGLALDLQVVTDQGQYLAFTNTGDYTYFYQNAPSYGFVQRFPKGKESVTGQKEMPAHFRYVGIPHAQLMQKNNLVLEEYLNLVRKHSLTDPLTYAQGNVTYLVYFVKLDKDASKTFIPLPDAKANYTVSGNHSDGFVVTVRHG